MKVVGLKNLLASGPPRPVKIGAYMLAELRHRVKAVWKYKSGTLFFWVFTLICVPFWIFSSWFVPEFSAKWWIATVVLVSMPCCWFVLKWKKDSVLFGRMLQGMFEQEREAVLEIYLEPKDCSWQSDPLLDAAGSLMEAMGYEMEPEEIQTGKCS